MSRFLARAQSHSSCARCSAERIVYTWSLRFVFATPRPGQGVRNDKNQFAVIL